MISDIALYLIFGKPLVMYGGLLVFASFLFTASISIMNVKYGIHKIPFKWHPRMAIISLTLALMHGLLAASIFYNF